ncbi:MAG: mannonate dehydratase [Candidatus Latescibacter sp.]|nr:mannonate dehydratase [Candidatus Latescibacter sp.]
MAEGEKINDSPPDPKRRKFGQLALSGILGGYLPFTDTALGAEKNAGSGMVSIAPGIKLAEIVNGMPDDNQFLFLKQLGVEYIEAWIPGAVVTLDDIMALRRKVESAGMRLFSTDILDAYNSDKIHLGLPGRDEKISQFNDFIRNLGKAGLHTTTYAWSSGSVYLTGYADSRGCRTRAFDQDEAKKKPLAYGREYEDEELWDNYAYFIRKVLPVAEEAGVRLALHPCDPPVSLCGVPQIFRDNASYRRALRIAGYSKYSGISFCVGTWAEMLGPDEKGEDILGAISEFGKTGNIFTVHFRNVSSPLPRFHETFADNGYVDMYQVMKAFREVNFNGTMVPDHVPAFQDEKRMGHLGVSGNAYTIGYMRALLERVNAEAK